MGKWWSSYELFLELSLKLSSKDDCTMNSTSLQKKIMQNHPYTSSSIFRPCFWTQSFLFPERFHCCYIYFHCSYMYNYYNYYLEPCALNAEFFHTSYPDLIKLPYFADITLREGIMGGEKRPKERLKTGWL